MANDIPKDTGMYLRYLGALGILSECSPYVPEDIRETIERAMMDAAANHPTLKVRRILDRIEIEPVFTSGDA